MDWAASGIRNSFEFEMLDQKLAHAGWLDGVTGGRITESYRGDYRVTASLDIDGQVPLLPGYVRIWHVAELHGETVRTCLATLCPERPSLEYLHGRWAGNMDLYSSMKRLDDGLRNAPSTLAKGSVLATYWKSLVNNNFAVAKVDGGISATAKSTRALVFDFGEPVLSAVHTVADALNGYVEVDPQGRVCLVPYVLPSKRPATWRLDSGERSIMLHGLQHEPAEPVNRVSARYESDGKTWYAHADAPASDRRSSAKIGRIVTDAIDVDAVVGGQSGWLADYAAKLMKSRLATSDAYEVVTLFDPTIRPGTVGTVDYRDAPGDPGVTFRAFCSQREVELDSTMLATLTMEAI